MWIVVQVICQLMGRAFAAARFCRGRSVGGVWKTRIAEPQHDFSRWHGAGRRLRNRNRLRSEIGKAAMRNAPRSSSGRSLTLWSAAACAGLGRENVRKRYLIHVAGHNLGILMRHLISAGTLKEATARGRVLLFVVHSEEILTIVIFAVPDADGRGDFGLLIVAITANPT